MRKDILTETLDGIEIPVIAIFVNAKWFYRTLRGEIKYYNGDEGVECYSKKIVKCRKPHNCSCCNMKINVGERAMCESGFIDGKPVSTYTCLECLDDWIEESQQCCSCCANEYGEHCENCSAHGYDYFKYKE